MFGNAVTSPINSLSPQQALELANVYLENAYSAKDPDIALVLCHDTETSLRVAKKAIKRTGSPAIVEGIATAYIDLGKLLDRRGHGSEAQTIYKKGTKLGGNVEKSGRLAKSSHPISTTQATESTPPAVDDARDLAPIDSSQDKHKQDTNTFTNTSTTTAIVTLNIFSENMPPPTTRFRLPESDERLSSTPQLACCLAVLRSSNSSDVILDSDTQKWLKAIKKDADEQERLQTIVIEVIRAFKRDELKDTKAIAEVVCLAPILNKDPFHDLLREFYSGIDSSGLLNFHHLEGLATLIQGADPGYLDADDLVKVLRLLSTRLMDTHKQSSQHMHQLTLAVSHVLDAMADTKVTGLDREKLHEPLSSYLSGLERSNDPYLVYQAAYAYQALLCVPDNETVWQAAMRRTSKVVKGVSGLVSAVKGLDLNKFIEGLGDIQKGLDGVSNVVAVVKTAYEGVTTLAQGGKGFIDSLKEGLSFERKRDWYSALRGADALIQDGELSTFKELVYGAPCRLDPAFQWGVCQRLGEIAANPTWDETTRQGAIEFLGEIYRNDGMWGQYASVKQWTLNILMQLSTTSGTSSQLAFASAAETTLKELESEGDGNKQALYRSCREKGPTLYPLKISQPGFASPSLLDRVQNRPDVEGNIRILRKQRIKERGISVYIPPQAKVNLQAADDARFPLMERVKEFLRSEQKVFLLLGDSGSGKSTFNRELEFELWQSYVNKSGRIPLHINIPSIDKPENDMIAKQLRKLEFTEPQINEMKHYRKFILICDGYDESQQTHNLYVSNHLNQIGGWDAQMVVSCRTEYIGTDYRDRFRPGDRNQQSDSTLFQEAVMAPFSLDQVQAYIQQYVSIHQPLWQLENYKQALEQIPSLKELVSNPFLMALSLEVLPRIVDPGQQLMVTHITRVALYDHFIEQWLERSKKRIGEKDMNPQSRAVFESLSDEGFTLNGIEYIKKLAVEIYKKQGGHPIVRYSRLLDEGSWKDAFFNSKDKKLLREACPLIRNGNQHRFVHRSLLEYGLSRAIFDPQDARNRSASGPSTNHMNRRGSVSSTLSFEIQNLLDDITAISDQEPDGNSPLVWRSFINDYPVLQFLEERVQQEPLFKQQLHSYIEHSKLDKKWRTAAANAITVLVRAGEQFIGADLQGIQIPGADLSYGVFDSAQLQDADMRKVNLRNVWLRQTDLSRAQMAGAQFGELPYLKVDYSVSSCAYSPDGASFAVSHEDGSIIVYSTSSWETTVTIQAHSDEARCIVFSPDGRQIASGSHDETVKLWNAETGEHIRTLDDHPSWVIAISYSPQGRYLASCSWATVYIWDIETGEIQQELLGHSDSLTCATYSPSGTQLASAGDDLAIRLWTETGDCTHILIGHRDRIWWIAYSPRGDQLASSSDDMTVRLWDVVAGTTLHILTGHSNSVYTVVYSPKGDQVASGGLDHTLRLWDVETGTCRQTMTGHDNAVYTVSFSPKGDRVASGSSDETVRLWDLSSVASRNGPSRHSAGIRSVACSPRGDEIATSSRDTTVRLWDAESGSPRQVSRGHSETILSVNYSPQGNRIVSGGHDNTLRLWDTASGDCQRSIIGHTKTVNEVAFSPQGDTIASGGDDMALRIWDASSGTCNRDLYMDSEVKSVVYSPDGSQLTIGCEDRTIRILNVETWECIRTLEGHHSGIRSHAYSPQGGQLASGGTDHTVRVWDLGTGECQMILIGHTDHIVCVAYTVRGDLIASASWDTTVRLWDAATGQSRGVIQNFPGKVTSVVWSSSQGIDYLIAGCGDGSLLKWQVVQEEDQCHVKLCWGATNGALTPTGATIQDVGGLTPLNTQLLKQRGAVGEPVHILRNAGKKLAQMASVLAKLKLLKQQETKLDSPLVNNSSIKQAETSEGSSRTRIAGGEQNEQQEQLEESRHHEQQDQLEQPEKQEWSEQRAQLEQPEQKEEPDTSDNQELPGE